jgi:hypothetical protein
MSPTDLREQVEAALQRRADIPWDLAAADIAQRTVNKDDAEGDVA